MALPSFTVVVPTRGRPRPLGRCIAALAAQDYPAGRFDVIVVDDGGTLAAEQERALRHAAAGLALRVVRTPHEGAGPARNRGVAEAAGRFIAFTDDDCRPGPGWLAAFERAFRDAPDALLGGRTVNGLPRNPFATASQDLIDFLVDWYDRDGGPRFLTSNNLAVARDAFLEAGGFERAFVRTTGEDRELAERWRRLGRPSARVPAAIVRHEHRMGLCGFLRQHVGYGRGAAHYRAVLEHAGAAPVEVEPPGFYAGMLGLPFRRHSPVKAALVAGLVATTQAANAAGYLLERRKLVRTAGRA